MDDNFQGATVQRQQDATFDAGQYSFFADLPRAPTNGDLGGALEDGLEAPPEEEGVLHEALGDELESPVRGIRNDLDGITDYTVAGMFKADTDLDQDLDPALLEARSLPRDMFAGDDEPPSRTPSQQQRIVQQQPHHLTPPPKPRSTPMTLAELEAQMASGTPQPHPQPQQPIMLSPDVRSPMPGMLHPQAAQPGLRGPPHTPQPQHGPHLHHPPGLNGAGPGMHMHPPGMPGPPHQHIGPHPHHLQHPHQGMMHGSPMHMPPMHASPMQPGSMNPSPMHPGPMQPPMHHMSPMQPGGMPPSPMQPGHPGPMHMMHGGPPHMFPHGVPPNVRPPGMMGPPGMHMNHMRSPGMPGGPPGMMWQHQPGPHPMSPLPPHMQQRIPPGMGGPDGHNQNPIMHGPGGSWGSGPEGVGGMGGPPRSASSPGMGRDGWHGPGGGGGGQSMSMSRPRYNGKLMSAYDVEHIMNILYSAVHAGAPYHEDYYYQAYVNQVTNGRNAASFKPEELRSLRPDVVKLDPSASVKFVAVHGLGKIVLTNIRTPKVLMDLTSPDVPADGDQAAPGPHASSAAPMRPLEQEPLLAARIMVEDCHDKLLDVDDIDRCFAAAAQMPGGAPEDPEGLRGRRALLSASVTAAFRLPAQPSGADAEASMGGAGDGVLMNIMTIPKGRSMLARALRVLMAQPQIHGGNHTLPTPSNQALASPEHLLWALLRHAYVVFGASISDGNVKSLTLQPLVVATHRLAAAAKEAIQHLSTPQQAVDAMSALMVGVQDRLTTAEAPGASPMDSVLPLAQVRILPGPLPDNTPSDWCGEVLVTLLQRGAHLGIDDVASEGGAEADVPAELSAKWRTGCSAMVKAFRMHVASLAFLQTEMTKAARGQGAAPAPEALAAVKALACRPLAQQLLGLMTNPADTDVLKQQLRQLL